MSNSELGPLYAPFAAADRAWNTKCHVLLFQAKSLQHRRDAANEKAEETKPIADATADALQTQRQFLDSKVIIFLRETRKAKRVRMT